MLTALLVVVVAVGVFLFVKNNPQKTAKIDQTAKETITKVEDAVKKQ